MLEDATWKKPRAHRTFQYIARSSLQSMLQAIAAHPEPFVDTTYALLGSAHCIGMAWAWMFGCKFMSLCSAWIQGKLTVNMTEMDEAGKELGNSKERETHPGP